MAMTAIYYRTIYIVRERINIFAVKTSRLARMITFFLGDFLTFRDILKLLGDLFFTFF